MFSLLYDRRFIGLEWDFASSDMRVSRIYSTRSSFDCYLVPDFDLEQVFNRCISLFDSIVLRTCYGRPMVKQQRNNFFYNRFFSPSSTYEWYI